MSHDHRIKYNAMFDFECLPYIKLRGGQQGPRWQVGQVGHGPPTF